MLVLMALVFRTIRSSRWCSLKEVCDHPWTCQGVCLTQCLVLSIITDLICAALPAIFLRNLQINLHTKIGLCVLMGLGIMYAKSRSPVYHADPPNRTAVCCTVRTALSGDLTNPDLTCQFKSSPTLSSDMLMRLPNRGDYC